MLSWWAEAFLMGWRNLWRSRRRTLITLAAGAGGLFIAQTYTNLARGAYTQMIEDGVRAGTGHVAVYRRDYRDLRDEALTFDPGGVLERLRDHASVKDLLPRLYLPGLARSARESRGVLVMGVDLEAESRVNPLFRRIVEGKPPGEYRSPRRALVGATLAEELGLSVGSKFVCMVQGADGELASELLRVGGLVRSGIDEVDKGLVLVRLSFAQRMAGREGQVHELALFLASFHDVDQVEPEIRRAIAGRMELEAVGWDVAMPNLADAIKMDYTGLKVIVLIVYCIVAIGIVNTLLMSVMERTREFGVLKALGTRPRRIVEMVVAEAAVMGLLSATLGTLLTLPATWALVEWGIDLSRIASEDMEFGGVVFSLEMHAVWAVPQMVGLAATIVGLFVVGSIYPARRAGRVLPVESLRFA